MNVNANREIADGSVPSIVVFGRNRPLYGASERSSSESEAGVA